MLLFGVAATLVTGLLFGIAPALQSTRLDLVASLKDEAGAVVGSIGSARLRKALVAAQVALSFLLLVGAGLFARTLANLKHADIGLQSIDQLVTFGLNPAKSGYTVPQLRRFYDDVLREVRATPDVDAAAFTWMPLLQGWAPGWHTRVEGHVPKEGENVEIENNIVSPGYWRTMGIKVVEGRDFDVRDAFDPSAGAKEPNVAIVNRRFAERFFGHQSAVGRRFGVGEHADKLGIADRRRRRGFPLRGAAQRHETVGVLLVAAGQLPDSGDLLRPLADHADRADARAAPCRRGARSVHPNRRDEDGGASTGRYAQHRTAHRVALSCFRGAGHHHGGSGLCTA